jgi:hypothetical protein
MKKKLLPPYLSFDDLKYLNFGVGIGQGRVLRVQPQYTQAQCLHGWLGLGGTHVRHGVESNPLVVDWKIADKSLQAFEEVLNKGSNVEALMGRAYYYELKQEYTKALGDLSQVFLWLMMAVYIQF